MLNRDWMKNAVILHTGNFNDTHIFKLSLRGETINIVNPKNFYIQCEDEEEVFIFGVEYRQDDSLIPIAQMPINEHSRDVFIANLLKIKDNSFKQSFLKDFGLAAIPVTGYANYVEMRPHPQSEITEIDILQLLDVVFKQLRL